MPINSSKTLTDFDVTCEDVKIEFERIMQGKDKISDLRYIFDIAIQDLSLFPNFNLFAGATYEDYIARWVHGYEEAMLNLPSGRVANPKSSCSDPAINIIVQFATNANKFEAEIQNKYHNLFMSAENIQGNLLEEYISTVVRDYGWLWCNGNVLRAIDFCTKNGSALIQIKNKSNTENSSSSAIRDGTSIQKWFRLGTKTHRGEKFPTFKWNDLNSIINSYAIDHIADCNMTELKYQKFLKDVASRNPRIITSQ